MKCDYCPAGIKMYHVTNQSKQKDKPDWGTVEARSIANDKTYDGALLGLPLASFTTTLNKYQGIIDLPTISPYPRNRHDLNIKYSGYHWRVITRFNMNDYHIFLMGDNSNGTTTSQVQLLCIRKSDDQRDQVEDEVYGILLKHFKNKKLTESQLKKYFPKEGANVYDNKSPEAADRMFVNVHFTFDYKIPEGISEWDTVRKQGETGEIVYRLNDIELNDLRSLWCMKHHFKALNNTIVEQFNEKAPEYYYKLWKIAKDLQSEFKQTFDEWENELIHKLGRMQVNN